MLLFCQVHALSGLHAIYFCASRPIAVCTIAANLQPIRPATLLPAAICTPPPCLRCGQHDVHRSSTAHRGPQLQVNVLSYFETLCTDTNAANVLINSSLTILMVRMLRNARAPTLRVRLASALGLLVRHATYIADELASTGQPVCTAT